MTLSHEENTKLIPFLQTNKQTNHLHVSENTKAMSRNRSTGVSARENKFGRRKTVDFMSDTWNPK